jgi:hypothetical protein
VEPDGSFAATQKRVQVAQSLCFLQCAKSHTLPGDCEVFLRVLSQNDEESARKSAFMQLAGGMQKARAKPQGGRGVGFFKYFFPQ